MGLLCDPALGFDLTRTLAVDVADLLARHHRALLKKGADDGAKPDDKGGKNKNKGEEAACVHLASPERATRVSSHGSGRLGTSPGQSQWSLDNKPRATGRAKLQWTPGSVTLVRAQLWPN